MEKVHSDVIGMLVEGNSRANIEEWLASEGVKDAGQVFDDALEALRHAAAIPVDLRKTWALEALRELYRRLLATGDYSGAIRAVAEFSKLSGLYPAKGAAKGAKNTTKPAKSALLSLAK